jgi:hypothetical protein
MTDSFGSALALARSERIPAMALRPHSDDGSMDDVVVKDVETFRAEQLDDGLLWMACYFRNGERITFNVFANRKNNLTYDVGELPERWIDLDSGSERP